MNLCPRCSLREKKPGQSYCRECGNAYVRKWNTEHPDKAKATNKRNYLAHHDQRLTDAAVYREKNHDIIRAKVRTMNQQKRDIVLERKKDAPCADCGLCFPPEAMDFDHVRGEKKFNIATAVRQPVSIEAFLLELEKCELVCACCHRVRTHQRAAA